MTGLAEAAAQARRWLIRHERPQAQTGLLAQWRFGIKPREDDFCVVDLPVLRDLSECWLPHGKLRYGRLGAAQFVADEELMVAELKLSEHDFHDFPELCEEAYRRLTDYASASGYPFVLRVWNYFSAINEGDGDEQRYKQFCVGRQRALERGWFDEDPAATVIGRPGDSSRLQVIWLASKTPGRCLDNPRQITPRRYPRDYGPTPPRFSRAMLWEGHRGGLLLISGTASLVGHASQHPDDLPAQVAEIRRNIDSLLVQAGDVRGRVIAYGPGTVLRAYVRDSERMVEVQQLIDQLFPADVRVLVVEGEVCRPELLVEIEGVVQL